MDALINLTSRLTNPNVSEEDKLKAICKTAAEAIAGADLASYWCFSENFSALHCLIKYNRQSGKFQEGGVIERSSVPAYFDAILTTDVVSADNARQHPTTRGFTAIYFQPNNIYSLLDYIIHHDFKPTGVLCCETLAQPTRWSEDDVKVLKRIARSSSLYMDLNALMKR